MTQESFPLPPRIEIVTLPPRPMTIELARDLRIMDSFALPYAATRQSYMHPYIFPPGPTAEELADVFEKARLGEVDDLMRRGSASANRGDFRNATRDQTSYIWLRDNRSCHYCKGGLIRPIDASPDHYWPYSSGHPTVTGNLVCSCVECNFAKYTEDGPVFDKFAKHPKFKMYRTQMARYNRGKRGPGFNEDLYLEGLEALEAARKSLRTGEQ